MNNHEVVKKITLDAWHQQVKATTGIIDKLTDDELQKEIAPSRNRGTYLLGHLTAVHDLMLPLLGFEEANYPELKPAFIDAPDKAVSELPPVEELREKWKAVNEKLANHLNQLPAAELFSRHTNVSEEDFAKEPHRNKLGVLLSRTNHLSNHRGQLVLLTKKD